MDATASVEESFHINKLLDYLPIIIISVIFLVGFFSWNVVRSELASFMMLILVFIYALWVMKGDVKSYKKWLSGTDAEKYILPSVYQSSQGQARRAGQPQNPFEGKVPGLVVGIIIAVSVGLGLGFGSIPINNRQSKPSDADINSLNVFGGAFSIIGIVLVLYSLWKIFREDASSDAAADKSTTKKLGLGGFIGSVLGFYMVARAKIIENESKEILASPDKAKETEYKEKPDNNGASTALVIGLVLQVIGYALAAGGLYAFNMFDYNPRGMLSASAWAIKGVSILAFFMCGILWIAKSQNWPGFTDSNTGSKAVDSFDNNVFAAHGGIYMIFAVVFLVLTIGALEKSKTYYFSGVVLAILLFGCYIWNAVEMGLQQSSDKITKEQSQILREEVAKELKKNAVNGAAVTDEMINDAVVDRVRMKQKPSEIVNGVFMTISVVIILMITVFRTVRLRMGICGGFPDEGNLLINIFKSPFIPPDANAVLGQPGYCDKLNDGANVITEATRTKAYDKIKKGEIDNVTGAEWDALLNTYSSMGNNNFSPSVVRIAKGAMWNPFLLVILIISWVAILFTRVSTSETTNAWIAQSFTGDMFPKVKELIDTFFIVLIVGLLLCGILLLPMVKELNVGGLNTILRFAESIQVWQYNSNAALQSIGPMKGFLVFIGFLTIGLIGLSWYWHYLRTKDRTMPDVPYGWGWAIALAVLFAFCSIPGLYFLIAGHPVADAFENESGIVRIIRLLFTAIYLIPWLFVTVFKLILYGIPGLLGVGAFKEKAVEELNKFKFWEWKADGQRPTDRIDLRLFPTGDPIDPKSVTSMAAPDYTEKAQQDIIAAAAGPNPTQAATDAKNKMEEALKNKPETLDQTKVGAIGKLIKAILLTISFVILILTVIYYVYKVGSNNRNAEEDAASGGFVAQLNSPTAQVIYVIMAIVAIAGVVAYIRGKFTKVNSKTPEDYLFDDYKPEDTNTPMKQLTFGMTHIIYIVLMVIVWVYDTEQDDKNRMSVTGMTVLGLAILFFHYFLEFIDNKKPGEAGASEPVMLPFSNLLTNIRFIVNTIFFILLCALAYYKQHSVMVVLIIVMFLFHLTKSFIGVKFLRLIWLCIIYIPCLFLGLLTKSQGAIGDTTPTIWIILAIEILLIAILYGGPYLLNYIGASNSQIIAAPIPLRPKHDTGLNAQSPKIFIFHNTGLNRSIDDKAANCPPEEKKRYSYSISGWFWLNNNVTANNKDLEIFNFGGVPTLTYNPNTNEFKVSCKTINLSTGTPNRNPTEIYNSLFNYKNTKNLTATEKGKFDILNELQTDKQLSLQKWNYFVINYDGKSMDVFLNNELVAKSTFIVPDITIASITSGDDGGTPAKPQGLSGNICNVAFHKEPLTLEQIRWTYNMLKSQDPPMIGMKTIADEVKSTGSTNVYSQ